MQTKTDLLATLLISLCFCGISPGEEHQELEITGQVADYMARPVEGAEVAVYEREYRDGDYYTKVIAPMGETDRDGRVKLQATVSRQRDTFVVARKKGLALAGAELNYSSNTKGRGHFLLVLEKACTVTGVVVDHTGKAVPGAEVRALPQTDYRLWSIIAPVEWFTTATNDKGVFNFNQFSADVSTDFWVSAPNLNCTYKFTTHCESFCGFEVWRPDIRLTLPQEGNIKGRVVEAGTDKPVSGVKLTIQTDRDREDILNRYCARTVVAGADGTFVCAGLAEDKHKIKMAEARTGTAQWVAEAVEVNLDLDRPMDDIKVSAEKGGIIECVVRDTETKRPLPRMYVVAYNKTVDTGSITDDEGKARIRVLPRDYELLARGQHYPWGESGPVAVSKGQVTHTEVHLAKPPVLEGAVAGPNGQPAKNVLVNVHQAGNHAYTDSRGRFAVGYDMRNVDEGLLIVARDMERSNAAVLLTSEFDKPVELALGPALTVRGKVTDPAGAGVRAARIALYIHFGNGFSRIGPEVLTDSKGRFEFNAVPPKREGSWCEMSVHAPGFGPRTHVRVSIEKQRGTVTDLATIQLTPADSSISGIVVDANGLPAARIPVLLYGSGRSGQPRKATATNEKGQFAFKRICKAPLRLQVEFRGGTSSLTATGGDKDVKIVLGENRVHTPSVYLIDGRLPELAGFNLKLSPTDLVDKKILVCFFDMEQRPSRNCLGQLRARAQQLKAEDVVVVAVQASEIDQDKLDSWVKGNNTPFPLGMVQSNEEKIRFTWGVRSLPWLILTDRQHIVTAEGFGLGEVDEKIKAAR